MGRVKQYQLEYEEADQAIVDYINTDGRGLIRKRAFQLAMDWMCDNEPERYDEIRKIYKDFFEAQEFKCFIHTKKNQ